MPLRSPQSGRYGSGGSGRAPKTTAGRKPVAKPVVLSLPSPVAPLGGDLQAALGSAGVAAKAKRSKARWCSGPQVPDPRPRLASFLLWKVHSSASPTRTSRPQVKQ